VSTMQRRSFGVLAVIVVAVASFALFGSSLSGRAGAQVYPPTTTAPGGLIVPPSVAAGTAVTISGASCGANLPVTISFNGVVVTTTTTDASGNFSATFTVPANTPPGVYSVSATSSVCVLGAQVTVSAAGGNALAFTGSSGTSTAIYVGLGLLVVGGVLVVAVRRRRGAPQA